MTHPLFEGTKELARRFREERRTRKSLSAEEFLDAQADGPAYPAGIARAQWVALLEVVRNVRDDEVARGVEEWLARLAKFDPAAASSTLPLEPDLEATLPAPAVPAESAQFIDRRYRIVRVLGEGAFGKVFLVKDKLQNEQELALKLIKKEHTATSEALMRFKNEILLLRVLSHPGIPQIFNDGISEDGEFYYTMAYVAGRTLDDVIRKEAPLDPARIVRITKQVLDVLDYAHGRGAIHRDLKPGNIFLLHAGTPKEQVRVLDFGIAKVLSREGVLEHAQTMNTEMPLGTPHYMSPEQVRGTEVDGRTDLYALGVIIYQMCSGRFPFSGKTLMEILAARLEKPPNPLEDATTPVWLRDVVMKLLERERDQRPDTTAIRVMLDQLQTSHRAMSKHLKWITAAAVVIAGALLWSVFGGTGKKSDDTANAPSPGDHPQTPANGKQNPSAPEAGDAHTSHPSIVPTATDRDGDGVSDSADLCPDDALKTAPGACGCGKPDTDSDGDGTADCVDDCPNDKDKTKPGKCGCGVADVDSDGDGVLDCLDDFPNDPARSKRSAETPASPSALPAFAIEKLEPALGSITKVAPQQKLLRVSGHASRPLASVRINGVKFQPDSSDPTHFDVQVDLPEAPRDGADKDETLTLELVDKDELKTIAQKLNYRRMPVRVPKGCSAHADATIDDRGRASLVWHDASKILLALVDEGPGQPGFYLGVTEVRNSDLSDEKSGLSWEHPIDVQAIALPGVSITLDDAKRFCDSRGLRLPTTAEWDRAAALASHVFPWGDEFVAGACNSSDAGDAFPKSAPVRSFPQDKCGPFFDMAGNVSEWCVGADGKAALRGGSWKLPPNACKLTAKNNPPSMKSESIGFRVALSCEP